MSKQVLDSSAIDEIAEIRNEIQTIESGLNDQNLVKIFSETKKSCVLYLAERYERLNEFGDSEIPTNQIANFLVKKFEKLNIEIHHSTIYDNLPQYKKISYEDGVLVIQDKERRIFTEIGLVDGYVYCTNCKSNDCEHVTFAYALPELGMLKPIKPEK